MVYKRYIKINGKKYGPYYYESHRDKKGKVVSKYRSNYKPKIRLGNNLLIILILIGIAFLGVFLMRFSSGKVVLDISSADYSVGEKLNGTVIFRIDSGDSIVNSTPLEIKVLKNGVLLSSDSLSLNDFLTGQLSPVKVVKEEQVCENVTIETPGQVCENVSVSNVVENCTSSLNENNESVENCINESVSSIVENCSEQNISSVVENCTTHEISDYYFNQPGTYSRLIADFLDYNFTEAGEYDLRFESPGFAKTKTIIVSENKSNKIIGILSTPGEINGCQELDVSGTYIMNVNIPSASAYCMNISVNDITLDCNGFYIKRLSLPSPGIYAKDVNNITIKNCNVTMSSSGGGSGIYFINVSNSIIDNFTTPGNAFAININASNNISIINSNIRGSKYGIILNHTSNSFIYNVNSTYTSLIGMKLFYSDKNNISNCNFSLSSDGGSNGVGILVDNSNNNSITNSIANNNHVAGFSISNSFYNTFQGCISSGNALDISASGANSTHFIDNNFANYSFDTLGNFISKNSFFGEIDFNNYINGSGSNLSDDIKIGNNSVYVNSSQTGLNVSANISLYNMPSTTGYIHQKILRDGVECNSSTNPICNNSTSFYSTNIFNFSFGVSSWSNYSFYRGDFVPAPNVNMTSPSNGSSFTGNSYNVPFVFNVTSTVNMINCSIVIDGSYHLNTSAIISSGNQIIVNILHGNHSAYAECVDIAGNVGDSLNISFSVIPSLCVPSCSGRCGSNLADGCGGFIDCGSCGGGGGGGGGGSTPVINKSSNFSSANNSSTPNVNNQSQNTSEKPLKIGNNFNLGKECNPDWSCGEWSECNVVYSLGNVIEKELVLNGERFRVCVDKTNCMFDLIDRENCEDRIPIIAKKGTGCFEGYIEIYDMNNTLISILNLKNSSVESLNINFILDNTFYCPYCYDGILDGDETNVDCGGSCGDCFRLKPVSFPLGNISWEIISIIAFIILIIIVIIFIITRNRRLSHIKRYRDVSK